jgi:hypothetical protein
MELSEAARIIDTLDFFDSDLDDWMEQLSQIVRHISTGEVERDPYEFTEARKKINSMLESMEVSQQFIALKRNMQLVNHVTADVETLFSPDQPAMPYDAPPEDLRLPDEDRSE